MHLSFTTDESSEYFEGVWIGQITCPPKKGDLEMSITSSCTRDSGEKFKCTATDCSVVKGKLPHNLSEVDVVRFSSANPAYYLVTGYKIEDLDTSEVFYFNPDCKCIVFSEAKFDLFGLCSGRNEKQGNEKLPVSFLKLLDE